MRDLRRKRLRMGVHRNYVDRRTDSVHEAALPVPTVTVAERARTMSRASGHSARRRCIAGGGSGVTAARAGRAALRIWAIGDAMILIGFPRGALSPRDRSNGL